jgi:calcineurin-like phosphoesterase family protein
LDDFKLYENDFVWVRDYYRLIYEGQRIVMFHYPILEWDQIHRGAYHVFGHVHNSKVSTERMAVLKNDRAFNAGVDVNNFRPVNIMKILKGRVGKYA